MNVVGFNPVRLDCNDICNQICSIDGLISFEYQAMRYID